MTDDPFCRKSEIDLASKIDDWKMALGNEENGKLKGVENFQGEKFIGSTIIEPHLSSRNDRDFPRLKMTFFRFPLTIKNLMHDIAWRN